VQGWLDRRSPRLCDEVVPPLPDLHGFVISNASVTDLAEAAQLINRLLAQGILRIRVAEVMSLDDAAQAHRMVESRQVKGRIVLRA
jgi:NADPH:quinone reductase-like Zn-dependent oxidoreductase